MLKAQWPWATDWCSGLGEASCSVTPGKAKSPELRVSHSTEVTNRLFSGMSPGDSGLHTTSTNLEQAAQTAWTWVAAP